MIDYIHSSLFGQSGVNKQIRITHPGGVITNKDLYFEQFSLNESISSGDSLKFGACEASSVKFRVRNIMEIGSLVGQRLSANLVLNHDTDNPFALGVYKGYSDTPTADRKYRDIVAYDAMYEVINANVATWYAAQYFPLTLRTFRQSFAAHFGLEEVDVDLVNDDLIVERTIIAEEVSGKTILSAICEINGCFGHINRAGKLEYIRLNKRGTAEISKYKAPLKYENYVVAPVTKVHVRQEEGDVGGTYGDGENCYVVDGNFLVYGKTQTELTNIAKNILEEIGGINYRPYSVTTSGNPCIEVGDRIITHTKDMDVVGIVTSRAFKGIQAMQDTYTSSGKEKQLQQLNSAKDELRKLKARANILARSLEETRSQITQLESNLEDNYLTSDGAETLIQQSAKGILSSAKKYTDTQNLKNIVGVTVYYAVGTSSTEPPTSGWNTTPPQWEDGLYMWQKTLTAYGDGTTKESDPVNISGARGQNAQDVRIDSSGGYTLKEGEEITLTARIFDGTKEIDADGKYSYLWYGSVDGKLYSMFSTGKTVTVSESMYDTFMNVYFVCNDENTNEPIAGMAIVGLVVVG